MPKLSDIINHKRRIGLHSDVFEIDINVTYKPGQFTPNFEAEIEAISENMRKELETMQKEIEDGKDIDTAKMTELTKKFSQAYVVNMLTPLLSDWDLQDDDDKIIPITSESIAGTPYPILNCILYGIKADMRPNLKNS